MTTEPFEVRWQMDNGSVRPLISSIRVYPSPSHWRLHIWNRGGKAGELCVNAADGQAVIDRLIPHIDQVVGPAPMSLADLVDPEYRHLEAPRTDAARS